MKSSAFISNPFLFNTVHHLLLTRWAFKNKKKFRRVFSILPIANVCKETSSDTGWNSKSPKTWWIVEMVATFSFFFGFHSSKSTKNLSDDMYIHLHSVLLVCQVNHGLSWQYRQILVFILYRYFAKSLLSQKLPSFIELCQ